MTRKRKSIAYAYPSSPLADKAGRPDKGGYFVKQETWLGGSWFDTTHPGDLAEGMFDSPDDPELHALFEETEGEVCPLSLKYHPEWYS